MTTTNLTAAYSAMTATTLKPSSVPTAATESGRTITQAQTARLSAIPVMTITTRPANAAVCNEFENLQIVFALDFHAVDTVPENYLRHERHGACYALCDITLVVEHTFLLSRTQKIPEAFTLRGNFCVPKIIRIAYAAT